MAWIVSLGLLIGGLLADTPDATEILLNTSTMFAIAGGLYHIGDKLGENKKNEKSEKSDKNTTAT